MRRIRVLVVEDSILFQELLVAGLQNDPMIEVVASAVDPFDARDKIIEYKPDVMTLDIELPKMDGIEFLRKLMPQYPLPVVMVSSLSDKVFDAMQAGAVDFVVKPSAKSQSEIKRFVEKELPSKIKAASKARTSQIRKAPAAVGSTNAGIVNAGKIAGKNVLVAIGASTGGTEAIAAVVRNFGPDIPGTVVVQHMPPGFTEMYAKRLDGQCRVHVKEARTGDVVLPGQVLIAPGGDEHMRVVKVGQHYQVEIKKGPKVNGHRPSVDVLFESVAKVAKDRAIGIILTGMGGDGARGLLQMRENGARTIGQNEASCVVYGMPKVAYDLGAVQYQESLTNIAQKTYNLLNQM